MDLENGDGYEGSGSHKPDEEEDGLEQPGGNGVRSAVHLKYKYSKTNFFEYKLNARIRSCTKYVHLYKSRKWTVGVAYYLIKKGPRTCSSYYL